MARSLQRRQKPVATFLWTGTNRLAKHVVREPIAPEQRTGEEVRPKPRQFGTERRSASDLALQICTRRHSHSYRPRTILYPCYEPPDNQASLVPPQNCKSKPFSATMSPS